MDTRINRRDFFVRGLGEALRQIVRGLEAEKLQDQAADSLNHFFDSYSESQAYLSEAAPFLQEEARRLGIDWRRESPEKVARAIFGAGRKLRDTVSATPQRPNDAADFS